MKGAETGARAADEAASGFTNRAKRVMEVEIIGEWRDFGRQRRELPLGDDRVEEGVDGVAPFRVHIVARGDGSGETPAEDSFW